MSVAVDRSGQIAYAGDVVGNQVLIYKVNPVTGGLTGIGSVGAGNYPFPVIVDPSGKFAYAANSDSNNIQSYTGDATIGGLTSTGTATAGSLPSWIAVAFTIE
jgi:6-phosphogluconolactonase (cycloisomerase 2 family)